MDIENAQKHRTQIKALLETEKLPVADLPKNLSNFLVATADGYLIGVAGIEIYGDCGLLRSVAVKAEHRGLDVAAKLVDNITLLARQENITELYLLTDTAAGYFKNKGFTQIGREEVPEEIKKSSEFSYVCPASAIVMKKSIL
jgi:amino-acid N-acetyltransferase